MDSTKEKNMKTKQAVKNISCTACGSKAPRTEDDLCVDCRTDRATENALSIPGHTPGPWHELGKEQDTAIGIFSASGRFLARTQKAAIRYDGGSEAANARLITSAPEGLTLAKIVADMKHLGGEDRRNQEIVAYELAKSIIAKVEGR
jgi:hypothetical protein